jgi:hypothetical protein
VVRRLGKSAGQTSTAAGLYLRAAPNGGEDLAGLCCAGRSRRAGDWGLVASCGSSSVLAGFRFAREVIAVAFCWYLRYGLSYRGGCSGSPPSSPEAARPCRHAPGAPWFAEERYVTASGRWAYKYRAVEPAWPGHRRPAAGQG